jgi:tritrans,polycis-undecaprenyl-diphosphate synthase [geranylgeranyl-diphosphate specific]
MSERLRRVEDQVAKRLDRMGERVLMAPSTNRILHNLYKNRLSQFVYSRLQRARTRRLLEEVRQAAIRPQHVGVIMDGNRRFAQRLGLDPVAGHVIGRRKLEELLEWCLELDIRYLTVYAFSTENFNRAADEVELLMELFEANYRRLATDDRVHKNKIRIRTLGHKELLPANVREAAEMAEEATRGYSKYFFNVAVAYGGREELLHAFQQIATEVHEDRLAPAAITQELVAKYLYTNGLPDPDLILRTSGEERVSNFLLWQAAYSELYFADVYWPALRKKDFLYAIQSYQRRQRRYGK